MGFGEQLRRQAGDSFLAEDLNMLTPRIEIWGNRRVSIENHEGILEYGQEMMQIKCGRMVVKICGEDLELRSATLTDLSVTGRVVSVELI